MKMIGAKEVFVSDYSWKGEEPVERGLKSSKDYIMEVISMTLEEKLNSLKNKEDEVDETVSEKSFSRSIEEMFNFEDWLTKKNKKSKKKRKKIKKEFKNAKKKRKELKKLCETTQKEMSLVKQDLNRLKKSGYDNKLNELIACDDPAERKRLASELKRMEV